MTKKETDRICTLLAEILIEIQTTNSLLKELRTSGKGHKLKDIQEIKLF
jgi:hypothetical protein